jgi:hypothetical protein
MRSLAAIALIIGMIILGYPEFIQCRHRGGYYFTCALEAIWVGDIKGLFLLIYSATAAFVKMTVSVVFS